MKESINTIITEGNITVQLVAILPLEIQETFFKLNIFQ